MVPSRPAVRGTTLAEARADWHSSRSSGATLGFLATEDLDPKAIHCASSNLAREALGGSSNDMGIVGWPGPDCRGVPTTGTERAVDSIRDDLPKSVDI